MTKQEQIHKNSQLFSRVKTVKTRLGLTWDEVAKKLGDVDRSLFFHVKANKNSLGDNVVYLLEQAEIELGIAPPPPQPIEGSILSPRVDSKHTISERSRPNSLKTSDSKAHLRNAIGLIEEALGELKKALGENIE